ncbi:transmembrane protein 128 [Ambystoma mexicanum]|uniref:transmembrane protein 128 n=1 Tax=Ambystoma mexicanum TaxID=8296 RepID=UPI0037E8897D
MTSESSEDEKKKNKPLPRVNTHSVFWILASVAATYYVEFFKVVKEHLQEGSLSLLCGGIFLIVSLSVAFYCIIYLEWFCGIADYDSEYRALVPITISTFIVASICYNIAFWPVWSFLTPLLLFTQFMGVVMLVSLLG